MHTCPFCGEECDCDMDDTGGLPVPDDCLHICDDPDDEEWNYGDDDVSIYCVYCGLENDGGYCCQSPDGYHRMIGE